MPRKTRYLKLPYSFDLAQLVADLAKVRKEEWISHFNTAAYENDWRCARCRGEVFAGDPPAPEHEGEPCAPIHPLYEKLERLRLEQNLFATVARP